MNEYRKNSYPWFYARTQGSDDKVRLEDKIVDIMRSNTGVGNVSPHELSKKGSRVIMFCRALEKSLSVARKINKEMGNHVDVMKLDLASLESVRRYAQTLP